MISSSWLTELSLLAAPIEFAIGLLIQALLLNELPALRTNGLKRAVGGWVGGCTLFHKHAEHLKAEIDAHGYHHSPPLQRLCLFLHSRLEHRRVRLGGYQVELFERRFQRFPRGAPVG